MQTWLTAESTYQGFPLFLRRPANINVEQFEKSFANLVVVTHHLSRVLPSGLPEADYNQSLAELDHDLVTAFDCNRSGVIALVETFGGERNYYFYVKADADVTEKVSAIARLYPSEKLAWSVRSDPSWSFIKGYEREHF